MVKNGASPQGDAPSMRRRTRALSGFFVVVGLVISSLLMGAITASADASVTTARSAVTPGVPASVGKPIPEYYQFCYDRTPKQQLQSTRSATARYWYKNAVASSKGVECQYMYAALNIKPATKKWTHSWTTVCKAMKAGKKGNWDAKRKLPYCTK